jgi:hypothetical protein
MAVLLYGYVNDRKGCATSWNSSNNPYNHIEGFLGICVFSDFHIYKQKNHEWMECDSLNSFNKF